MAAPAHGHAKSLTEEEKANAPKVTKELLGRIFGYLKPYWLQLLFVFVAILAAAVVGLFPSIITGKIVDEALVAWRCCPCSSSPPAAWAASAWPCCKSPRAKASSKTAGSKSEKPCDRLMASYCAEMRVIRRMTSR